MTAPRMSKSHYEFIADKIGPLVSWPSHIHSIADVLAATNPKFDRDKFMLRATTAWEENRDKTRFKYDIEDEINF